MEATLGAHWRAVRHSLEAAGVELSPENGGGAGVRLRRVEQKDVEE